MFVLIIHKMWARPGGVYNDFVKDSYYEGKTRWRKCDLLRDS